MHKRRDYWDYIRDIQDAINDIEDFVKAYNLDKFLKDKKTINAVVRSFEIIGEAVKKIPAEIRRKNKSIPWKEMAGMRNILIHEYFGINIKVIWKTVQKDIPNLKILINNMLSDSKQDVLKDKIN